HCPQMQRWFHVEDEKTVLFGIQFKNRSLVTLFALVQLVVACVSFAQHVYSVAIFNLPVLIQRNALQLWPLSLA
uniref:Uncharacterized protein n=1 Tax=Caenorhabditis japonica TaxID=281687 RepID=A0A8R1ESB1_CAEJA